MSQLTELCNARLKESDEETVTRRCLEKDIEFIQKEFGLIERERSGKNTIIRYVDRTNSIFNQGISISEKKVLQAVCQILGKMDGLEDFSFLEQLKVSSDGQEQPIIVFERNEDLVNRTHLPTLLNLIESKATIEIVYHPIKDISKKGKKDIFPCLLKQYHGRWFLFGMAVDTKEVMCYSLDQIDEIRKKTKKIEPINKDWEGYFDDMIGVSRDKGAELQEIIFWASREECAYLKGKPIHRTQTMLKDKRAEELRQKYHIPNKDGKFFRIKCIDNFELRRELASKFGERIVLEPIALRNEIAKKIKDMVLRYDNL